MSTSSKVSVVAGLLPFHKYHGCGNDFVCIDNRSGILQGKIANSFIQKLCDRHFGIGADGVIILEEKDGFDYELVYFNSADGAMGSFCGNGARCSVAFARFLGIVEDKARFTACDGSHQARILSYEQEMGLVELNMNNVYISDQIVTRDDGVILNTGSPHFVKFVDDLEKVHVIEEGRKIRYTECFRVEGINVNFVQVQQPSSTSTGRISAGDGGLPDKKGGHTLLTSHELKTDRDILLPKITIATYERGVEDETFACGTGSVASAIAHCLREFKTLPGDTSVSVSIETKGGMLEVRFKSVKEGFENVKLIGPAVQVFRGEMRV